MNIHQRVDWPHFTWDTVRLVSLLGKVNKQQGRITGLMQGLGFDLQNEAILETLTLDAIKTSAIEGEKLNPEDVRSSIAKKLGMNIGGAYPKDRHTDGLVDMLLDASRNYQSPVTKKRLCAWHFGLFPTGTNNFGPIKTGDYRDTEMAVTSSRLDKEEIFFEAPESNRIKEEMNQFLNWINSDSGIDPILKAAQAHLWFITIHPFDDGNGRIARAITDLLLARSDGSHQRFYSMSAQIEKVRKEYYLVLERTQKRSLEITDWMQWFLETLMQALANADKTLEQVLNKQKFWNANRNLALNDRQIKVLNKLLDGFEGNIQRNKYGRIAQTSKDTAFRDLQDLVNKGLLTPSGKGRGAGYQLIYPNS
ncbi:MAG: DUF4172 domain-containing protein [Bacteroidetes bacterium]|nr:MAG: DUF4172 domain-containing protein [Bacteroidota bacterium]